MAYLLNRSAVLITPKRKFLNWIRSVDVEGKLNASDKDIKGNSSVYLVDDTMMGDDEEIREIMEINYLEIAIQEFAAWWTAEDDWPMIKSLKVFEEYFIWKLNEMVIDTIEEPYELEEI